MSPEPTSWNRTTSYFETSDSGAGTRRSGGTIRTNSGSGTAPTRTNSGSGTVAARDANTSSGSDFISGQGTDYRSQALAKLACLMGPIEATSLTMITTIYLIVPLSPNIVGGAPQAPSRTLTIFVISIAFEILLPEGSIGEGSGLRERTHARSAPH